MGFFNLQVTVVGHASLADISTTTRPFFAYPSVPANSMRDWSRTRSNPTSAARTGRSEDNDLPAVSLCHRTHPKRICGKK